MVPEKRIRICICIELARGVSSFLMLSLKDGSFLPICRICSPSDGMSATHGVWAVHFPLFLPVHCSFPLRLPVHCTVSLAGRGHGCLMTQKPCV